MKYSKLSHSTLNILAQRRKIAENLIGTIEWQNDVAGLCVCPGEDFHTTRTGAKDCQVSIDGTPTVFCFHQSCLTAVVSINTRLREKICRDVLGTVDHDARSMVALRSAEKLKAISEEKRQQSLAEARLALPKIIRTFEWGVEQATLDSPVEIPVSPEMHTKLFLREMFSQDSVIWTGQIFDSGKPEHSKKFRTVKNWLTCDHIKGPYTCASTFKSGVHHRSNDSVRSRPYLVLEGDLVDSECATKLAAKEPLTTKNKHQNKMACLAVINWFRLATGLVLRAVVDAANKSMHGWFDMPDRQTIQELKWLLPGLGFDPAVLRPAQPVRLPGARRAENGLYQKLIYLNPLNS